jgi:hypothetical protein
MLLRSLPHPANRRPRPGRSLALPGTRLGGSLGPTRGLDEQCWPQKGAKAKKESRVRTFTVGQHLSHPLCKNETKNWRIMNEMKMKGKSGWDVGEGCFASPYLERGTAKRHRVTEKNKFYSPYFPAGNGTRKTTPALLRNCGEQGVTSPAWKTVQRKTTICHFDHLPFFGARLRGSVLPGASRERFFATGRICRGSRPVGR